MNLFSGLIKIKLLEICQLLYDYYICGVSKNGNLERIQSTYKRLLREGVMKIRVEGEKIIKAVKKFDGIEILLENQEDAKEAINLILRKTELFHRSDYAQLKDVEVTSLQEYKTSAVDYKIVFLLNFVFDGHTSLDTKVAIIKELQEFFRKV